MTAPAEDPRSGEACDCPSVRRVAIDGHRSGCPTLTAALTATFAPPAAGRGDTDSSRSNATVADYLDAAVATSIRPEDREQVRRKIDEHLDAYATRPAVDRAEPPEGLREALLEATAAWLERETGEPLASARVMTRGLIGEILALPALAALLDAQAAVKRVEAWVDSMDALARDYDAAAAAVSDPELVAQAHGHAEDVRASAEGVRRALGGPS